MNLHTQQIDGIGPGAWNFFHTGKGIGPVGYLQALFCQSDMLDVSASIPVSCVI